MAFFDTQNPGIGGLNELTTAEELFLTSFAGQSWVTGDLVYYNGATLTRLPVGSATHVLTVSGGLPSWQASSSGSSFIGLTDVPATYTGQTLKAVRVNAGETALEFFTLTGGGDALVANPLSQFAATTSLQLKGVISDETGSGALVFADTPTLVTPVLGVATATSINGATITSGTLNGSVTGTNTGDQTSIVGITGTKAQFDSAVTDGNILYVGDITQYTDEMAQDTIGSILTNGGGLTWTYNDAGPTISAVVSISSSSVSDFTEAAQDSVGAMVDTSLTYVDGTPLLQRAALTGHITASAGSNATLLGSFTKAQLDTAVSDGNILYVGDITQYTDELAQDAVGLMVDSTLVYTDVTPLLSRAALTGHVTASAGSNALVLGSFTKAQLDTAVSDGNVLYVGDVTQYTDELAQDAIGAMVDASLTYVDGTPLLQRAALTGAVTATAGSNATVLGSFTLASLNTAVSDANIIPEAGGTFTGDISVPDEVYGVGWNGSVEVPTKNALYDKIEAIPALVDGDKGDIVVSASGTVWDIDTATVGVTELSATGTPSATTFLRGDNTWATPSGSGGGSVSMGAIIAASSGYNLV